MKLKFLGIIVLSFFFSQQTFAHAVVGELEKMSRTNAVMLYLKLGYQHIVPLGIDHILFVLSLFLLSPKLTGVLWQATAFTVAHSVTLSLAMFNVITPNSYMVEALIAISIIYVAVENICTRKLKTSRIAVVFLFGLLHGMGFANALSELGLPQNAYLTSLLMFNVGVELGQICVIVTAFFLFGKWFGNKPYYRKYFVIPMSSVITVIAFYWAIERLLFV